MTTRREFLRGSAAFAGGLTFAQYAQLRRAQGAPLAFGLSDPATQPKFKYLAPNALDPGFIYRPILKGRRGRPDIYNVSMSSSMQQTGLEDASGALLETPVYGYGPNRFKVTWPGMTFEVKKDEPVEVIWQNHLTLFPWLRRLLEQRFNKTFSPLSHLLPVDTSLHWAYSLPGYEDYSIEEDGVPVVPHLHGGHSEFESDGNPQQFFSPGWVVRGPNWEKARFHYDNDQVAGTLWYHDHALGITRFNVYAGLAGFYILRDDEDTGKRNNPLGLPAAPYELAYAIQDRMFTDTGELFYPAFPGDPFYDDFIAGEGAVLPPDLFPGGGPTALAEFFGDHMLVNGVIWPKTLVEPRNYRMRVLNGTDSRFMVLRFRPAMAGATDLFGAGAPLPFTVIGSDQGLASSATITDTLVFEPGARYDIVVDFSQVPTGSRVIMENIGGDSPFGGAFGDALDPDDLFPDRQTDRIMAFDVDLPFTVERPDLFQVGAIGSYGGNPTPEDRVRQVALFEGLDEFGRLQPLLGNVGPATDFEGAPIVHASGPLVGLPIEGATAWHEPATENPALGDTEIWEIFNATGDAHPMHLHQVNFQVLDRREFTADVVEQPVLQHNGEEGLGFRLENIVVGNPVNPGGAYVENAPKDMVTALPGQVTRIKATFDRPGRYVWHCHILSHEDHEMMRVLHVGPGAHDETMVVASN